MISNTENRGGSDGQRSQHKQHHQHFDDLDVDLGHYLRILRKYRWQIAVMTAAATALAIFYVTSATPLYRATSTLQIESNKANIVSIEEIYGVEGANKEYYQTQFELLKSRALAQRVIEKLDLSSNATFNPPQEESSGFSVKEIFSGVATILAPLPEDEVSTEATQVQSQASSDSKMLTLTEEDWAMQRLVDKFMVAMTVEPVRNTQLVKITFTSPSPELAATVANEVGNTYIESYLDAKMELTQKAAVWLSDRLGGLKLKLEESEQRLIEFREANQLVDVSGSVGSLNEQQVTLATAGLASAQRELSEAETLYREIVRLKESSPELLESFPMVQADPLVRSYKLEQANLQRTIDELSNRYGARHPKILDAQSNLQAVNDSLSHQIDRIIITLRNNYEVASQNVAKMNRSLAQGKAEIQEINKKKFQLAALEREVDANRKLYDTFFKRIRETSETDGIEAANARISEYAVPPTGAFKPKKSLIVMLAFFVGLIGSVLTAFLREFMDRSVKSEEEIERQLRLPILGIVPMIKSGFFSRKTDGPLTPGSVKDEKGTFRESVRTIRTAISLDSLDPPHKLIAVTSSYPSEGKSTLASNIAFSFSKLENVLLIDADMRRPSLAKGFGLERSSQGLADYLMSQSEEVPLSVADCIVRNVSDSHLDIMPSGKLPEHPLELLATSQFTALLHDLSSMYDRIVIDCAPTQAVSDALVVGKQADAVVFCVKSHATTLKAAKRSIDRLRHVGADVLGVAVTQVDVQKISAYGGDYYYQGYFDYYGYSDNADALDAHKEPNNRPAREQEAAGV